MVMTITATFRGPDLLMVDIRYEGLVGEHLAAHFAVLAHECLHGDWEKARTDGTAPQVTASFPESGRAGMTWSWSGLTYPQEQLRILGYCLLAKAYFMWGIPHVPKVVGPLGGYMPPGFFGRG